jgi:hypothetical protein
MNQAYVGRPRQWFGAVLLGTVFITCFGIALGFSASVANPVIFEDGWYFVATFVVRDMQNELTWLDFFLKRSTDDHAQPLHRLLLFANTHWFGLDFWYEGIAAVALQVLCALMLLSIALRRRPPDIGEAAIAALIPLTLLSLNSLENYTWSLVGLFYLALPFALLTFAVAASGRGKPIVAVATLSMMVALDGAGLLAGLAISIALLLSGVLGRAWRQVLPLAGTVLATCVAYKAGYDLLVPDIPRASDLGVLETLGLLAGDAENAWKWFIIPAVGSIAHGEHFWRWFGEHAWTVGISVGVIVLALHAAFWISVWRSKSPDDRTVIAVALMLFAYAMVAGVLVGRVPRFDVDYLWQHRYVNGYQLANVAMAMQWLVYRERRSVQPAQAVAPAWIAPALVFAVAVALQFELGANAYRMIPDIRARHAQLAATVHCLSQHKQAASVTCDRTLQVCNWPADVRSHLIAVLEEQQLNVFSPDFQRRHGMGFDPDLAEICLSDNPAP